MNRKKLAYLGLVIEVSGLFLMFICIIMNTIVSTMVQMLIWVGLAITMFSVFFCPKDITDKENQEYETKRYVLLPLIVLVVLTIALTIFSLR